MNISKLKLYFEYESLFDKSDDWWENFTPPISYLQDPTFLKLFFKEINFSLVFYDLPANSLKQLNLNKLLRLYLKNIDENRNTPKSFLNEICQDMIISKSIILKFRDILPWTIICYSQKLTPKFIDQILILEKQDKKVYIIWYAILANTNINQKLLKKYYPLMDKQTNDFNKQIKNQEDFWG